MAISLHVISYTVDDTIPTKGVQMVITCDIGSTNLKIQKYTKNGEKITPIDQAQIITHNQNWLNDKDSIQHLRQWLDDTTNTIVNIAKTNDAKRVGFSTFREGIIGLDKSGEIVFAGTNLRENPIGDIDNVSIMTTFAGWVCWRISSTHATTKGQRDAGTHYINRLTNKALNFEWASIAKPGAILTDGSSLDVYIGGTDEQLGYMGVGIFDRHPSKIVMATGTFWSVSFIAQGEALEDARRTDADGPFKAVDSFVLYRWGPMLGALADSKPRMEVSQEVPSRYFGQAAKLWFEKGVSNEGARSAIERDLRKALENIPKHLTPKTITVYGGGVRLNYARDLIMDTFNNMEVIFMEDDATSLGCAMIGLA